MNRWLLLALVVTLLDQASKLAAEAWLDPRAPLDVLPFLDLRLAYNPGAAFSFLADAGGWQRWFFSALALGVSLLIIHWLRRLPPGQPLHGSGLALILGGAVGNLIDRLRLGHVVDFLDVHYPAADTCLPLFAPVPTLDGLACHWPAFNLADAAIFLGAALYLIAGWREGRSAPDKS